MPIFVNARFLTQEITGVQRHAIELSKRLKRLSPEIRFISPRNVIHKDAAKELSVEITGKGTGHYWEQVELPLYLKKHGGGLLVNLANTAPLYYKQKIITIHDTGFLKNPRWYSKKFYYFYRFLIPRIAKNSLKIITDSEFARREIIETLKIPESKVLVVYCAPSSVFQNRPGETGENRFGDYILTVSSLDPRKNLERTILAFKKLNRADVKLVIVGAEKKIFASPDLEDLIQKDDRIILTGYVADEELVSLYRHAKFFIFASLYEGFGLPPLEAMACDCPCVVSSVASLPEVCGSAVLYCDPYSIEDIADNILKMFVDNELRTGLIKRGRERIKMFGWEKSARVMLKVLEELSQP